MLKAILDTLDGLSDEFKALYKEGEGDLAGKFVLQVEPVSGFALENIEGLTNTLTAQKSQIAEAKAAVEGFKGLDAKQVRKDLAEYEKLKKFDPETEADKRAELKAQSIIDAMMATHGTEKSAWDARESVLKGAIERLLLTAEATAEIAKAKGVPELLLPHVLSRARVVEAEPGQFVVEVLNERGAPDFAVRNQQTVPATLADLVAKLKANPTYGRAFEGAGHSGSGARPGSGSGAGGKNPFLKGASWNLTEQMKMKRENPSLAAAMQAQASGQG